jgi:hypothetical protein
VLVVCIEHRPSGLFHRARDDAFYFSQVVEGMDVVQPKMVFADIRDDAVSNTA